VIERGTLEPMPRPRILLLMCLLATAATATALVWPARTTRGDAITIATWNLEWLVSPATAHAGRLACRNGRRTSLPCDVAENARDSADLARLAAYVRELDADVIAFQEVEDESIAREIFAGYVICMADGSGAQHVGFAVRSQSRHRCGPMVESLAMGGRSRKGMSLLLTPAQGPPIELLNVHLKSGCSRDALDSDTSACRTLREQADHLATWIAERTVQRAAFIVLGDFNRVPPETADDVFWRPLLAEGAELLASLLPFGNCQLGQPYTAFIDHILISGNVKSRLIPTSAHRLKFRSADAQIRLSDHCPVSVSLNLDESPGQRSR
jgi:endonuclease/exonuclease/phosphatase family metal-dependent hydrolase